MKRLFIFLLLIIIFTFQANAMDYKVEVLPPDSTSTLVERTAALYLIEEGKKAFYEGRTRDALRRFREAYVRDQYSSNAVYWIGKAHYQLDNFGYALKYAKISESLSKEEDGDIHFLLGQAYHRENKLDSAIYRYDKARVLLSKTKKNVYNLQHLIKEVEFADSVSNIEIVQEKSLLNENINSGYDDYSMVISNDGKQAFYVSRRPDTKGGNINPDDQRYFEDIYFVEYDEEENKWGDASNDIPRLNSKGFDAISHITTDNAQVYLTINTSVIDVKNPTQSSDICVSKKTREDRWSTPKPIKNKTINTSYFDGAPSLTEDENTMYFVSDRDGQKTQSDIFVVYKEGRTWGEAKKLPNKINTKGNETTPYITPDGRFLFFSSDRLNGMGGYDVYVTENKRGYWSDPVNLGPEFNTVNDDIFFKYYEKLNKAIISTYRIQGNKSSIDIFEVDVEGWEIPQKE